MSMTPHFAVFNLHINDADQRARKVLKKTDPHWLKTIEKIEKKEGGIMAVMNHPKSPAVAAYVALVTLFVNGEE